jgi:hypothetical protein
MRTAGHLGGLEGKRTFGRGDAWEAKFVQHNAGGLAALAAQNSMADLKAAVTEAGSLMLLGSK